MATWVIGDVQGCNASLRALLGRIGFAPGRDRAVLVGDLVNRGADSTGVLRWAMENEAAVSTVLGNHDLHLVGRLLGVSRARSRDTLDDIVAGPDRADVLEWLRTRPLALPVGETLVVHAGLLPGWTDGQAIDLAAEASRELRGPRAGELLPALHARPGLAWHRDLAGPDRWRAIVQGFTQVRTCAPDGTPDLDFKGPPSAAPGPLRPWFELRRPDATIVFGHWSALGLHRAEGAIGIDTGVAWGRALTALRLEDGATVSQPAIDPAPARTDSSPG